MELFVYALLAALAWYVLSNSPRWMGLGGGGQSLHCMTCGSEAPPVTRTRGSLGVELLLWLCLIVPGLIYSVWRLSTRAPACPVCHGHTLLPTHTPAAQAHRAQLQPRT